MLENSFYKQILDSSPIGYAYHKILCDEKGVPYDYQFIEANQAFEELTGLNRKSIIGKTISDVLPGIFKSKFDWIACYGEVALTGTKKAFEQYSEPLKKWYRVNAFSPEKGFFVTTIVDITNEKEHINDLSKILKASNYYFTQAKEFDYKKITDMLMALSEAKVAAFNIYDEKGDTYKTVAIAADGNLIRKGTEFLGMNPKGKVWKHDPIRAEKIKNQVITRFNKLSDLTGDVIPSAVVDQLGKSFGLGESVLVKITKDNRMIGDFTLIMEDGKAFDKDEICEIYAKQLGLAIEIKRAERSLSSSRQEYMSLVKNAPGVVYRCLNNKNWTMLMLSNEIESITGYHSDRFIKDQERSYASIFHPEDAIFISTEIKKAILADQSWNIEYRVIHKDGSIRWVHENGRGIKNEEGDTAYLDGIVLDTTKQKETEEKLRKSEELNKAIVNVLPDIILKINEFGDFLDVITPDDKLLYMPKEHLINRRITDVFPEEIAGPFMKAIKEAFSANALHIYEYELSVLAGKKHFEARIIPDNNVTAYAMVRDISERKRNEEELIMKQEELDTYFTSSLDMLCIANTKGEFIRLNPEWEKVLGYPIKELEGSIFLDYVHPDDLDATLGTIKDLENQKEVTSFTNRYRRQDGSYRWIEWRSKPVNQMIYSVARDITEQRQLEEKLRSSNNLLDVTFNSIQDGIIVLNADLTIREVNRKITELYGESTSFVDRYCYEVYQNRKTPCQNCLALKSIETKETCYKILPLMVDGHQKGWLEVFAYPMIDPSTGNLEGVVELIRDITERIKIEKQIIDERERFKTTLLSVGDGVISVDEEGKVLLLNPIAEQLTGWKQKEASGRPIEEVFHVVDEFTRKKLENPVRKVFATGEILKLESNSIIVSKYGTERPIEDSAAPIRDKNGVITGVVLVFRDFTEKKRIQDEIEYLSFHDHLTGLYNRRFFEAEMERLDTERNLPISIIMGDVNGLKLTNDSFGHFVGDELLVKATSILKSSLRTDDIVARVGGDEVAILLPKTDKSEAKALIGRMLSKLKKEKTREMEVSVSFGWATKTNPAETLVSVLKKAEDHMYSNKLFEGPSIRGKVIDNIIATINKKSPREKAHSERVSKLCVAIGGALEMDERDIHKLKVLGLFHDIGKIAVADDILNKPGKLTKSEYKEICRHAEIGYRILSTANGMAETAEYVLYHHERWDGKGYPKGLAGELIPLPSRICALSDAYDAMTSDRSYRSAMKIELAVDELKKNAGTQFDPGLVKVFTDKVVNKNI